MRRGQWWGALAAGLLSAAIAIAPTSARAVTVELNLLYVHGVHTCASSRITAHNSLASLGAAVQAALPAQIANFEASHPGVHVVVNSAYANLYTATSSGIQPSDSPDPLNMDDWEVGDPGCSTTQQGDPCTTAYEWRYRLVQEINRFFPAPAANIILIGHSTGARTAMEVTANVGPSGAVNTFDWGVRSRIAGVMTVHGMLDAIGTSKYNFVGPTSFEFGCKNGDVIGNIGGACAPGNGWCEYAGRVDGFPAADWVATNRRALMLTSWGSCSPSAFSGNTDGGLPYDAQGSPLAVGLDMTPAPGQTYRPSHGERYGAFCHSAITNTGNAQHTAARDAARQRLLDWLFLAAPRVANSGSNTTPSIAFNQFSATFPMGSSCPAAEQDDTITMGTKDLGIDVVGVCRHPGFFDGDDHPIAMSELTVTNGPSCNGTYRWQQAHDASNPHAATFWWKTRSLFGDTPDLVGHTVAAALARCGDGVLDPGEACDDGNQLAGDCCSATCELEPAGGACPSDGNPCTNDVCNATGVCTHVPNAAPCDDGIFCNGSDTCSGGACALHSGDPCAGGPECNRTCTEATHSCAAPAGTLCTSDGNVCTDNVCNGAGACTHPPNTAPCDDGLFCNGADTCSGGSCALHSGDPCAGGPECNRTCTEATHSCAAPAGTLCASDGNVCTDNVCNGAGACTHPPNSAPCDDGVFCNGADTCAGGSCSLHTGDPCASGPECNRTCTEATQSCADPAGGACTDDGNPCTADRCDGAGACAHPPQDGVCDDGDRCTIGDVCSGGACAPGPRLECGRCAVCDAALGCVHRPRVACKQAPAGKSKLRIRDGMPDDGDALTWTWRRGERTTLNELGSPEGTDAYTLCLFDEAGAAPELAFAATVPGGQPCGIFSCWRRSARAYAYKNRDRSPEGIELIRLLAADRSSVVVKGKGPLLSSRADGLPPLPLGSPLRVQLHAQTGTCWEAVFSSPSANKSVLYRATSD